MSSEDPRAWVWGSGLELGCFSPVGAACGLPSALQLASLHEPAGTAHPPCFPAPHASSAGRGPAAWWLGFQWPPEAVSLVFYAQFTHPQIKPFLCCPPPARS